MTRSTISTTGDIEAGKRIIAAARPLVRTSEDRGMSMKAATHILAEAGVRYWEDAYVNDIEDTDGTLIPGRDGDVWRAKIELATGKIEGWPEGTTADIHYKVCDAGEYWLLNATGAKIAYRDGYVPGDFLCHGDRGYGDYIIMTIGPDGQIADYTRPVVFADEWQPCEDLAKSDASPSPARSA